MLTQWIDGQNPCREPLTSLQSNQISWSLVLTGEVRFIREERWSDSYLWMDSWRLEKAAAEEMRVEERRTKIKKKCIGNEEGWRAAWKSCAYFFYSFPRTYIDFGAWIDSTILIAWHSLSSTNRITIIDALSKSFVTLLKVVVKFEKLCNGSFYSFLANA